MLQSTPFPQTPAPTVTIADVLQFEEMQRFARMAIAAKIIEELKIGAGMNIADDRLVDGSAQNGSNTAKYASLPLIPFSKMPQNSLRSKTAALARRRRYSCACKAAARVARSVSPLSKLNLDGRKPSAPSLSL